MKVIQNITGKTIKYCNIINGADGNEKNIIATTNNEIMMFSVDYDNGDIKCYTEEQVKRAICFSKGTRNELLSSKIITQDEVDIITKANEDFVAKRQEKLKQQRYEEYLRLKAEFEPQQIGEQNEER